MKKRNLLCVFSAFAALTLASCSSIDAAALVETFDQSINTTVKLTYNANYDVNAVREGGGDTSGIASHMRKIRSKAEIEMDLGSDLYIKVSKERSDLLISDEVTLTEDLLYKKDGAYYYQSSNSVAVQVENPQEKLEEILETATYEQAGFLSLDTLLYNSLDKEYELATFSLSDTFLAEDLVDPVYTGNKAGGLHVEYKPEYIGYRTDMAWSDFSNKNAGYAAVITLDTNEKGYVTSMTEQYNNAELIFNIMTPPPTVTITGERSFTASYGVEINKVDSVALNPSKAVYEQSNGGTFVVMTCALGDFGNMVAVENNGALELGKILCIKPTPAAGKEVSSVSVNGETTVLTDPANAGSFYCFNVVPGVNEIKVSYSDVAYGVVTVTNESNIEYQLQSFKYGAAGPENYQVITDGNIANPSSSTFGAIVIAENIAVVVTVNGTATTINIPDKGVVFYCFNVKTAGEYKVVITPAQ